MTGNIVNMQLMTRRTDSLYDWSKKISIEVVDASQFFIDASAFLTRSKE